MTAAAPDPSSDPTRGAGSRAPAARPALPNFVAFVMAVAFVWLGGQFVRQGLSDDYLTTKPEIAVLWLGESSDALTALARQRLVQKNPGGAARLAARAIQLWPLNAPAITIYGLAMDKLGQPKTADAAISLASTRGWRDVLVQEWLFRRDVLAGQYDSAFEHADALMRRVDAPPPIVLQILAVAAHDPKAIPPLAARLAANPSWRTPFFNYLARGSRPPQSAVADALLTRLAAGPAPPTEAELQVYLGSLVAQGKFAQAQADWRRFSPASAGSSSAVHDGGFEQPPGLTPFDWSLAGGVGWTATIGDAPDGGHGKALKVEYDGVSPGKPLGQLVVLAPGAYHLSGKLYDEGGAGEQTLAWQLVCVESGASLAVAPPALGNVGWRAFGADFTVPATGCSAQWLELAARPGDVREDVTVWYDDLAIGAAAGTAAVSPKP